MKRGSDLKDETLEPLVECLREELKDKSEIGIKDIKYILKSNKFEKLVPQDLILRFTERIHSEATQVLTFYTSEQFQPQTKILRLICLFYNLKFTPGKRLLSPPTINSPIMKYISLFADHKFTAEVVKYVVQNEGGFINVSVDLLCILSELLIREEGEEQMEDYNRMLIDTLAQPSIALISIYIINIFHCL